MAGTSSGAVLFAAAVLAARPENAGRTIVAIVADSGERYLSQAGDRPRTAQRDAAPCSVAPVALSPRLGAGFVSRPWTARDVPLG